MINQSPIKAQSQVFYPDRSYWTLFIKYNLSRTKKMSTWKLQLLQLLGLVIIRSCQFNQKVLWIIAMNRLTFFKVPFQYLFWSQFLMCWRSVLNRFSSEYEGFKVKSLFWGTEDWTPPHVGYCKHADVRKILVRSITYPFNVLWLYVSGLLQWICVHVCACEIKKTFVEKVRLLWIYISYPIVSMMKTDTTVSTWGLLKASLQLSHGFN